MTADTNVFVYAVDKRETGKRPAALGVVAAMRRRHCPIALQLAGEFQNVLRRKLKTPAPRAAEMAFDLLTDYRTFIYDEAAVIVALKEAGTGRLAYWDALMLAAAAKAGCTAMLSEDLQDGARIFGLEIVNPFAADGLAPRAAELLAAP